jgi:proline iminopeptidase
MPQAQWPEPVTRAFGHVNSHIYTLMQGPSELGASGVLEHWDRSKDLHTITVPTLVIAGKYDTMDPDYMAQMARKLPKGQLLLCPKGSHMSMYDDQQTYFTGLVKFLQGVEAR